MTDFLSPTASRDAVLIAHYDELAKTAASLAELVLELRRTNDLLTSWVLPAGIKGLASELEALQAVNESLREVVAGIESLKKKK